MTMKFLAKIEAAGPTKNQIASALEKEASEFGIGVESFIAKKDGRGNVYEEPRTRIRLTKRFLVEAAYDEDKYYAFTNEILGRWMVSSVDGLEEGQLAMTAHSGVNPDVYLTTRHVPPSQESLFDKSFYIEVALSYTAPKDIQKQIEIFHSQVFTYLKTIFSRVEKFQTQGKKAEASFAKRRQSMEQIVAALKKRYPKKTDGEIRAVAADLHYSGEAETIIADDSQVARMFRKWTERRKAAEANPRYSTESTEVCPICKVGLKPIKLDGERNAIWCSKHFVVLPVKDEIQSDGKNKGDE